MYSVYSESIANSSYYLMYDIFERFIKNNKDLIQSKYSKDQEGVNQMNRDLNSLLHVKDTNYGPRFVSNIFLHEMNDFLEEKNLTQEFKNFRRELINNTMRNDEENRDLYNTISKNINDKNITQKKIYQEIHGKSSFLSQALFTSSISYFSEKMKKKEYQISDFEKVISAIKREIEPYKSNFGDLFSEINSLEALILKSKNSNDFEKFYHEVIKNAQNMNQQDFVKNFSAPSTSTNLYDKAWESFEKENQKKEIADNKKFTYEENINKNEPKTNSKEEFKKEPERGPSSKIILNFIYRVFQKIKSFFCCK